MINDAITASITGALGLVAAEPGFEVSPLMQGSVVAIMALLTYKIVTDVVAQRRGNGPAAELASLKATLYEVRNFQKERDASMTRMFTQVDDLISMHKDPNSGFSTVFMVPKVEKLIELAEHILEELRKR